MARYVISNISNLLNKLEYTVSLLFRNSFPPEHLALIGVQTTHGRWKLNDSISTLSDLIGDGFLWAVPKHRRSVERRLSRKFGHPDYVWKPLKLKTHLRACNTCGHDHEIGVLCPQCYAKVRDETKLMQDKIQEKLGLDPIENEIVVLYQGEKNEQPPEFLNGKRIVEMEKPRPNWFSKNLIQKSTQKPADTKEVKPSDLG